MSDYILKNATILNLKTKQDTRDWLKDNLCVDSQKGLNDGTNNYRWKPVIIQTNFNSFFDCLEDNVSKICNDLDKESVVKNIKNTKEKIGNSNAFNFLKNSSIWLRLCENEDWDGNEGSESQPEDVKIALEEFTWFLDLGLYDFKSAKEFIEYNVRAQRENYLEDIGGHGTHVTPVIYSNECEYRDFFMGDNKKISFKYLKKKSNDDSKDFRINDVELRILLVDDIIGNYNTEGNTISCCTDAKYDKDNKKWEECEGCKYPQDKDGKEKSCKLDVVRKLLEGSFILDETYQNKYKPQTYWADKVQSYCVQGLKISDFWRDNDEGEIKLVKEKVEELNKVIIINNQEKEQAGYVQIIGVRDLESALVLMSCCKFDIIMLDYLLGDSSLGSGKRTYSTELFEFLSFKFKNDNNDFKSLNKCPDIINMLANSISVLDENKMLFLEQFRDNVKLNRGPLDKYWIVPMTSYNSSFITDLQSKHVQLIDHRWNISQGADPINTPWRFLYKLNEFVDLQLRQSVFWGSQLMTFVQYTGEDLEDFLDVREGEQGSCFEAFQQFMGAEYANFMKRYGARKLIERDAAANGDNSNKSLFSTYITKHFYNNPEYYIETELNQLMQRFYHRAASMFDERYGRQRLREAFERLRVFISYNKLEDSIKDDKEKEKLIRGLCFLHTVIDSEFNRELIGKWVLEHPKFK